MKLNWKPTKIAFLDFETQSATPLMGAKKYARHSTTRVVCASMKVDGNHITWEHGQPCPEAYRSISKTHTLVAHNAPFDAEIWDQFVGEPAEWFDTLPIGRAAGLPGSLGEASKALFGTEKDPVGEKLISLVSRVKMLGGEPQYYSGNPFIWDQFLTYCKKDVDLLEMLYATVHGINLEPEVLTVDRMINDRGIPVCRPLLEHLADLDGWNRGRATEEFGATGANARSPKQVKDWLDKLGFVVSTVGREQMQQLVLYPERFYRGEPEDMLQAASEVELAMVSMGELTRTGGAKIKTALEMELDGRIYDQLVYYGAHTGRWSARQLQPHNFPGQIDEIDVHELLTEGPLDTDRLTEFADKATEIMQKKTSKANRCYVSYIVNSLLRTVVRCQELTCLDYGAVEARGVAWLCNEEKMLGAFLDPRRDVYSEFAETIYGYYPKKDSFERWVAKQAVLGCGYGLSATGFKRTFDNLISIAGHQMTREALLSDEQARAFVTSYRTTYIKVKQAWDAMDNATKSAVQGRSSSCCKCNFYREGSTLIIQLPSGRKICYRNASIQMRRPKWAKTENTVIPTVVFTHPHGYEGVLYGGRLMENITQAVCRDLMAQALVDLEREGLKPFLHVHDELLCATSDGKRVAEIMSTPPSWASNFPILVEGYYGIGKYAYWTKQYQHEGFGRIKALNGRIV